MADGPSATPVYLLGPGPRLQVCSAAAGAATTAAAATAAAAVPLAPNLDSLRPTVWRDDFDVLYLQVQQTSGQTGSSILNVYKWFLGSSKGQIVTFRQHRCGVLHMDDLGCQRGNGEVTHDLSRALSRWTRGS